MTLVCTMSYCKPLYPFYKQEIFHLFVAYIMYVCFQRLNCHNIITFNNFIMCPTYVLLVSLSLKYHPILLYKFN